MESIGTVSIIVPVYNVEKYIADTIDSVRSQTYTDWELLLVEDGSRDESPRIIDEIMKKTGDERIKLFFLPENIGAAAARNYGLAQATGRYISYLDSDDLWDADKLEAELAYMQAKDAAFVFSGYEFAAEDGSRTGKIVRVPESIDYKHALKNTTIFTSTVIFDTEKIDKNMLDMPLVKSEDTALWWKVLRNGYLAYGLDRNLVRYRRAGKSLSSNKAEAVRRIWNLYRNTEGMGVITSAWHMLFWAYGAVMRRI